MSAEPDLGRAILFFHSDERDIDDKRERDARMVEVGIVVGGLRCRRGILRRWKCGVPRDETK
jgi:hypothetical protein